MSCPDQNLMHSCPFKVDDIEQQYPSKIGSINVGKIWGKSAIPKPSQGKTRIKLFENGGNVSTSGTRFTMRRWHPRRLKT